MALGETAIHTSASTSLSYAIGLCSILGFPLFRSSCLFLYASSVSLPLFVTYSHCCWGLDSIAGTTLSLRFICFGLFCPSMQVFYFVFIFLDTYAHAWIHVCGVCPYLFLLQSFVGRRFGRFLRAELSSNGSSDPPSDSPSNLSSHQIPRSLRVPLQLKGCT